MKSMYYNNYRDIAVRTFGRAGVLVLCDREL